MKADRLAWLWIPLIGIQLYVSLSIPVTREPLPRPLYSTATLDGVDDDANIVDFTLEDVTLAAGITTPHTQRSEELSGIHESLGAGACAFDYDNDGWIDLLTLNGSGTTHFYGKPQWWQENAYSLSLYRNNRDGSFEDVTLSSRLQTSAWTMGCVSADFDNDGDTDVFIANYGENQLWRNNGDGSFAEITGEAGIGGPGWSTSATVVDVNNDGLLDIYVTNYIHFETNSLTFEQDSGFEASMSRNFDPMLYSGQANRLWLNRGELKFVDHARQYGIDNSQGRGLASQWFDIDDNGFPDLMVANDDGSANKVYVNEDGQKFTDVSTDSRLAFVDRAAGIDVADIDNDGVTEVFIATGNKLLPKLFTLRVTPGDSNRFRFDDVGDNFGLNSATTISHSHWGSVASDLDLDGWLDLVIANGIHTPDQNAGLVPRGQVNTLLINKQGKYFVNESRKLAPGTYPSQSSRCALPIDFDNDGAQDIYLTQNNGLGQLLANTSANHQWLGLRVLSNGRTAYGARVVLEIAEPGKTSRLERRTGQASFLCSGDQRIVFGLGRGTAAKQLRLIVSWPDGKRAEFGGLEKNRYYLVEREKDLIEEQARQSSGMRPRILVNDPAHKLTVIGWLIEHAGIDTARHELRALMRHADDSIRLRSLLLSQRLPPPHGKAFTQLALTDRSPGLRIAAIRIVREAEDELFSRWLIGQLQHADAAVACAAAASFAFFFDEEEAMLLTKYTALNPLIRMAEQTTPQKQVCAIEALGRSERYRALQPLIALLDSKHREVRLAAVKALGLLKDKAAISRLESVFLASGESPGNRAQALVAIKQIDGDYDLYSLLAQGSSLQPGYDVQQAYADMVRYTHDEAEHGILVRSDLSQFFAESGWQDPRADAGLPGERPTPVTDRSHDSCDDATGALLEKGEQAFVDRLDRCLPEAVFFRDIPAYVQNGLQQDNEWIRIEIFKRIAARKERWARVHTMAALNDVDSAVGIQIAILENLAADLSPALVKQLDRRFASRPGAELAPYIAKRLLASGDTDIVDTVLEQINLNLRSDREARAMLYAAAVIDQRPEAVLSLLLDDVEADANR